MARHGRSGRYFWLAITAVVVSVPLTQFRHEQLSTHTIFRVAWLLLLLLSLLELGRNLYQELRRPRLNTASPGTRPPDAP
jgi:hypothetical protein